MRQFEKKIAETLTTISKRYDVFLIEIGGLVEKSRTKVIFNQQITWVKTLMRCQYWNGEYFNGEW